MTNASSYCFLKYISEKIKRAIIGKFETTVLSHASDAFPNVNCDEMSVSNPYYRRTSSTRTNTLKSNFSSSQLIEETCYNILQFTESVDIQERMYINY